MTAIAPPRWVLLSVIGLAVAVLHVLVLFVLGPTWFDIDSPAPAAIVQPMQVRSVALAPPRDATLPLPPRQAGERQARRPRVPRRDKCQRLLRLPTNPPPRRRAGR